MKTNYSASFYSKAFTASALTVIIFVNFVVGNIGAAQALSGNSIPDNNESSLYYYANGNRIELTPSLNWVAVKFASADRSAQSAAVAGSSAMFGSFDQAREIPFGGISLLPLKAGISGQMLLNEIQSFRADAGKFSQVNPVFQTFDAEMTMTDEFIVTFPAEMSMEEINAFNTSRGVEFVDYVLGQPGTFVLKVSVGADLLEVANQYQESGVALYSSPNFVRIITTDPAENQARQNVSPMTGMNDALYIDQWHLNNVQQFGSGTKYDADIDAPEAWDYTVGDPSVIIAVMDEGVDLSHEDYKTRLVAGYDATGLGSMGAPAGNDAHGTNVSGLAAATSNNGVGVAGVCQKCSIMPVRIAYGDQYGYWVSDDVTIANGIAWAYQHGASILNNSWGGGGESTAISAAISNAKKYGRDGKGSVVVFSAGNNNMSVAYPAFLDTVIAVGASNLCDQRKTPVNDLCNGNEYWWGGNFGSALDISAPGVWLYSTDIMGAAGYDAGNYFSEMNGTSGSSPLVSGVAGLILSVNPNLTADEVQTILQNSADDVNGGGFDTDMGYGRVNAYNAVKAAMPNGVTISGNAGADGATLSYTDGTEKTATADGSGYYSFTVTSGWSGIVTPSKAGYLFTPSNTTYANVVANQTEKNYSAAIGSTLFTDVPSDYWARPFIESLYNSGITRGCGSDPLIYCPFAPVTRAQMAIFIMRGIHGSDYVPAAATGSVFSDVTAETFGAAWIEQFAAEGITSGCGGGQFCPDNLVTRAQIAVFLLKGKYGSAYVPPAASGKFADVPVGSFAADWIEQLAAEGISGGCGGGNFCPDQNVTRDQMAAFLVRAFALP